MARKTYSEPKIFQNHDTESLRFQTVIKRAALAFAIIIGIVALYFSLMPALAENTGGSTYVYFDNGLSGYDEVYYSLDGKSFTAMTKLSEASAGVVTGDNINPDTTYVSGEAVSSGTPVWFKGVDSGIVYDSVTSYRVNAASREWGYDYNNFTWTTDCGIVMTSDVNCYYGPALCMEYKYGGYAAIESGGEVLLRQFIYGHGDQNELLESAKPEVTDFISPNCAENRTFYDAQYTMIGVSGSVYGKNNLGDYSQSISVDEGRSLDYGADNTGMYSQNGNAIEYEGSFDSTGDGKDNAGIKYYEATATMYDYFSDWELAGNPLAAHTESYIHENAAMGGDAKYVAKIDFEDGDLDLKGFVGTLSGSSNKPCKIFAVETEDEEEHAGNYVLNVADDSQNSCAQYSISNLSAGTLYTVTVWVKPYDDFHYDDETINLYVYYKDDNGNSKIFVAKSSFIGKDASTYKWLPLTLTFEIPDGYTPHTIEVGSSKYGDFYLDDFSIVTKDSYFQYDGSFSEGTDRISYVYQGRTWNKAISDYYAGNANAFPLYFGSNSWFTGNGRYYDYDRDGTKNVMFTAEERQAAIALEPDNANLFSNRGYYIKSPVTGKDGTGGAYLQPLNRQYLSTLYGFNPNAWDVVAAMETPLGRSNSRGVPNLVELSNGAIQLKNTGVDVPYFNETFIEGDNSINTVLGKVYNDVSFKFKYNSETGYYEFDSTKPWYAVRLTENKNSTSNEPEYYMRYTDVGVTKGDAKEEDKNGSSQTNNQFYPFNTSRTNSTFATENLMFGMHLDIPFNMYKDPDERENSIFKFSGDDDVWVYIDGKQVLDIGGTHTAVGGFIDLKNGYAVQGSSYSDYTGTASKDMIDKIDPGSYDPADKINAVKAIAGSEYCGTNHGITKREKYAFAVLAAQEEIIFYKRGENDEAVKLKAADINALEVGAATEWGSEKGMWVDGAISEASFFDDVAKPVSGEDNIKYAYRARRVSDTEYVLDIAVTYIDIPDDEKVNYDKTVASFALSTFNIEGGESSGASGSKVDLEEHNLSIYYMERGLNSSNFKLAFNMVPNTEREVRKEWADGQLHENDTDRVEVELYRTEPRWVNDIPVYGEITKLEDTAYTFPSDISYVKIEGANSASSYQSNARFITPGTKVQTFYAPTDSEKKLYLTLNGHNIDNDAYTQLAASNLGLELYFNPTGDIASENRDAIVVNSTYFGSDAKGTYITVPALYQLCVDFNVVKSLSVAGGSGVNAYNITADGWLVEAHAYDDSGNLIALTGKFRGNYPSAYTDSSTGRVYGKDGMNLNFVMVKHTRYYTNGTYYAYTYEANVVPTGDTLSISSSVNDKTRYIQESLAQWNGVESVYENTILNDSYGAGVNWHYSFDDVESDVLLGIKVSDKADNFSDARLGLMKSRTYTRTYPKTITTTGVTGTKEGWEYTNAILIDTVVLDNSNEWYKLWDNIVQGQNITVDGVTTYEDYKYFIREVSANSSHGSGIEHFGQTYVDAYGMVIEAQNVLIENGDTLKLYPIDAPTSIPDGAPNGDTLLDDNEYYVNIINMPLIDIELNKKWSSSAFRQSVTYDIYSSPDGSTGDFVDSYTLTEANKLSDYLWSASVTDLPLYEKVYGDDGSYTWNKLTYYVRERVLTYNDNGEEKNYIVTYNTSASGTQLLLDNGDTVMVYPLTASGNITSSVSPSVTVHNRANNSGEFNLILNKVSATDAAPISGAEFRLDRILSTETNWDNAEVVSMGVVSDSVGVISFGNIENLDNTGNPTSYTYRITEVTAPIGYKLNSNPIYFTVSTDSEKLIIFNEASTVTDGSPYVSHTFDIASDTLSFVVSNEVQPIVLPNTGGRGIYFYLFCGFGVLTLILTGTVLYRKRSA